MLLNYVKVVGQHWAACIVIYVALSTMLRLLHNFSMIHQFVPLPNFKTFTPRDHSLQLILLLILLLWIRHKQFQNEWIFPVYILLLSCLLSNYSNSSSTLFTIGPTSSSITRSVVVYVLSSVHNREDG